MRTILIRGWGIAVLTLFMGCATPHFETVTIHDSPDQFVKLFHVPAGDSGKAFSHPVTISKEQMEQVLKGVMIQEFHGSLPLPFMKNMMKSKRHRAFSDAWVAFFTPKLIQGLQQATPEEVVVFFETGKVTSLRQMTTSGGVFVHEGALHLFLSNYHVLTDIGQDNEEYMASFRLTPLRPIHPEPGQLEFEPRLYMVEPGDDGHEDFLEKPILQVGVLYKKLPSESPTKTSTPNP